MTRVLLLVVLILSYLTGNAASDSVQEINARIIAHLDVNGGCMRIGTFLPTESCISRSEGMVTMRIQHGFNLVFTDGTKETCTAFITYRPDPSEERLALAGELRCPQYVFSEAELELLFPRFFFNALEQLDEWVRKNAGAA